MILKKSDRLAIVDFDNKHITYNEMIAKIKYYTDIIGEIKNEKILLISENRAEWIYTFFAIWNKKSAPVVVDAQSSIEEIAYFIKDSEATKIICTNSNYENVKKAVEIIKKDGKNVDIINIDSIFVDNEKISNYINDEKELEHPEGEEIAVMLYTSGTTSAPKGVLLTFNNLFSQIEAIETFKLDDIESKNEQILALLPFHHIFPLTVTILYFTYREYSIVLLKTISSNSILETLKNNRVTFFVAVPRVYKLLYNGIKNKIEDSKLAKTMYNFSKTINSKFLSKILFNKVHKMFGGHIKYFLSGGAKSSEEIINFFNSLGFTYCEGYGLTETSPIIAGSVPVQYKVGTIGKPVKNAEIKLVNDELWVKGPMVMKGYHNKLEKTKEVLTEDGWFKTGDLASIDEEGFITILGRKNSMIVLSNGKNIDPELLEEKLLNEFKYGVKEVAFLNNNDKLSAIIVVDMDELKNNNILNVNTYVKDAIEFYNSKAHNYTKILDYKIKEEELPKTRVGKIRRFMLNDMYNDNLPKKNTDKDLNEPEYKEYYVLKKYISNLKDNQNIGPDDTFEIEIGLDSLDLVELISYIENSFSIKINEEIIAKNNTLRKLTEYVSNNSVGYKEKNINWNEIIKNVKIEKLKKETIIYKIIKPIIWLFMKIYFRLKVEGKKEIPKNNPKIYVANHQSFIDALAVLNIVDNDTYFLAIDRHFNSKFMKMVANNSNIILVDIEKNVKDSIEKVANVLKNGKNVFIFPEGSRTKDGNLLPFKKIFAILAKELNVNIECLKIEGAYEAWPRTNKLPKPKKITVKYIGEVKPIGSYEEIVKNTKNKYMEK